MTFEAPRFTLIGTQTRKNATTCFSVKATTRGPELVERSPMLATALNPIIGYDEGAKIAKESIKTGRSIRELAEQKGVSRAALKKALDLGRMTKPGLGGPSGGGG